MEIEFSKSHYLSTSKYGDQRFFKIHNGICGDEINLYKKDVDDLIKALQKAKELWT